MNKHIYIEIKDATRLEHVRQGMLRAFEIVKSAGKYDKIGYVAGIVSSDGDHKIQENREKLEKYTRKLRSQLGYPVFSSVDVFGDNGVWNQLEEVEFDRELREEHFRKFWRDILKSGHVTDIFMTPRWRNSTGARDEHRTAKEMKIKIHLVDETMLQK